MDILNLKHLSQKLRFFERCSDCEHPFSTDTHTQILTVIHCLNVYGPIRLQNLCHTVVFLRQAAARELSPQRVGMITQCVILFTAGLTTYSHHTVHLSSQLYYNLSMYAHIVPLHALEAKMCRLFAHTTN